MYSMVFSGGSSKIPIHVGAYDALLDKGVNCTEFWGTSTGSIMASLLALNLPYKKIIMDFPFEKFFRVTILDRLLGLYNVDSILDEIFGKYEFPDNLHIIAHSLNSRTYIEFNKNSGLSVKQAVRCSISIPILFKAVEIGDDKFIDGGVSKDFPVDLAKPPVVGSIIQGTTKYNNILELLLDNLVQSNREESIRDSCVDKIVCRTNYDKSMLDFKVDKNEMYMLGYNNMAKVLENVKIIS